MDISSVFYQFKIRIKNVVPSSNDIEMRIHSRGH